MTQLLHKNMVAQLMPNQGTAVPMMKMMLIMTLVMEAVVLKPVQMYQVVQVLILGNQPPYGQDQPGKENRLLRASTAYKRYRLKGKELDGAWHTSVDVLSAFSGLLYFVMMHLRLLTYLTDCNVC